MNITEIIFFIFITSFSFTICYRTIRTIRTARWQQLIGEELNGNIDSIRFIGCSIIAHNITSIKDIESLLSSPYNRYEVIILLNQQHNPATAQHIIKHYRLTRVNNDLTRDCPLHIANLYSSTCRTYRRLVLVDCDSTDIYSTMNAAIGFASYDYIIPLQPHTCLLPHALESIVTTLSDSSNNNIGLLYNNTISPCYVFQRDVLISYGGVSNDIIKKLPRHAVIHSDIAFAYPNEYKNYSCLILIPLIVILFALAFTISVHAVIILSISVALVIAAAHCILQLWVVPNCSIRTLLYQISKLLKFFHPIKFNIS